MQSVPLAAPASRPIPPSLDDAPSVADGARWWSALCDKLTQRAKLDAEIVQLTGQVQRSGTIETLEGMTLDAALNLVHRLPRADRAMLLLAAEVLAHMPVTATLFASQVLSWAQVRGIVGEAKRLTVEQRATLDRHIEASTDRLAKMDPDDVIDAAAAVVQQLRELRNVERSEDRAAQANFVWGQTSLFGPNKVYGELDGLSFGAVFSGLDALTPADDRRSLAQRRADALIALATHRCETPTGRTDEAPSGDNDGPPTRRRGRTRHPVLRGDATPALLAVVEVADATAALAGEVALPIGGAMPVLSARIIEALATDARLQVVLVDNGTPLAVSQKIRAAKVPRDIATAIRARDRGDRFPGSRRQIEHLHHLDKVGQGHAVDALVGLAGVSHRRVHRCGWRITINGREVTFTRNERAWTTLPRGTRFRRPTGSDPPTPRVRPQPSPPPEPADDGPGP